MLVLGIIILSVRSRKVKLLSHQRMLYQDNQRFMNEMVMQNNQRFMNEITMQDQQRFMNQMTMDDQQGIMNETMMQDHQRIMDEGMKGITPIDHGGYLQGPGFNPSDTMAHDVTMNQMNDMSNMNGMNGF